MTGVHTRVNEQDSRNSGYEEKYTYLECINSAPCITMPVKVDIEILSRYTNPAIELRWPSSNWGVKDSN